MYKISKNLKYPLNLLEDAIGSCGNEIKYSCGEHYEAVREVVRVKSIEEILRDRYGIEANETFFKWLDKYIERKYGADVKSLFDKRYKEKKSLRQIQKETGLSSSVIENRIRRLGGQFFFVARDYKNEMGK